MMDCNKVLDCSSSPSFHKAFAMIVWEDSLDSGEASAVRQASASWRALEGFWLWRWARARSLRM